MSKTERGTERSAAPAPQGACLHGRYVLGPRTELDWEPGYVYTGRDQRTGEAIRIRAIRSASIDADAIADADAECKRLALIRKPHFFPRVRDLVEHDGYHYLVQEAIAGDSLVAFVDEEGELPSGPRIAHLFQQIADRLAYLHNHATGELLFRGLTPERVFVEADTRLVRLVDLSIPGLLANAPSGRPDHGTRQTIAPELYRDEAPSLRTDLYALGRVLQFLVFGETDEDPTPSTPIPDAVERGIPETVRELVTRMIAPDPSLRPTTVEHALRDFTTCLESGSAGFALPTPEHATRCEGCETPLRDAYAFCSCCGRTNPHHAPADDAVTPTFRATGFDRSRFAGLRLVSLERYRLLDRASELARRTGYERLALPSSSRAGRPIAELLELIRDLRGRALVTGRDPLRMRRLATSLITEYRKRGWLDRTLVICPAGLERPWQRGLAADAIDSELLSDVEGAKRRKRIADATTLVAAPDQLMRRADQKAICESPWDLVIIDAAHRCASKSSAISRVLPAIPSKYVVLLSAAPVQNDPLDLLPLLRVARPDLWSIARQDFQSAIDNGDPALRDKLDRTIVEMRPVETRPALEVSSRVASPCGEAAELYRVIADAITSSDCADETRVALHRALASAASDALEIAAADEAVSTVATGLRTLIEPSLHPKTRELVDRLADEIDGKAIVFAHDAAQCRRLVKCLLERDVKAVTPNAKQDDENDPAWQAFTDDAKTRFLVVPDDRPIRLTERVATSAVLFDLPWDPMVSIERLSRLREHARTDAPVQVTQLVAADTIEPWLHGLLHDELEVHGGDASVLHALMATMERDEAIDALIGRVAAERVDGKTSVTAETLEQRIRGIREHVEEASQRARRLVARIRGELRP